MAEADVVRSMVRSFRILELQNLMLYAGKSKFGRKSDLQNRALELINGNDDKIIKKVKELSSEMYQAIGSASSVNPYSSNYVGGNVNQPPPETEVPPKKTAEKEDKKAKEKAKPTKKSPARKPAKESPKKHDPKPKSKGKAPAKSSPAPQSGPAKSSPANDSNQRRSRRTAAIAASAALASLAAQDKTAQQESSEDSSDESDEESSSSSSESQEEETPAQEEEPRPKKRAGRQSASKNSTPTTTQPPTSTTASTTAAGALPFPPFGPPGSAPMDAAALAASYAHLVGRGSYMAGAQGIGPPNGAALPLPARPSAPTRPVNYCGFTYRRSTPSQSSTSSGQSHIPPATTSSQLASNNYLGSYGSKSNSHLVYPTFPDVKLKRLPFYDVLATLLKPSSLQPSGSARFQEQTFSFHLTPQQVSAIEQSGYRDSMGRPDYKKQIQVRFSLLETSCEQADNFPSSVCVKVNGRLQPLPNPIPTNKPGVEPKRPPKAINITGLCKLSSTVANYINVSWTVEVGRGYTLSVYFVERLNSNELLQKLKTKGQRHPDYTRAVIKDKLNDTDNEIATTSCKVSLACPLGKMRMRLPCRSSVCDHLQCFDANNYLMMNEKKDKWQCPVCNNIASFDTLMLDGYFTEMLESRRLPDDEHEIVLHADASWDPLPPKIPDHLDPKHFQPPAPQKKRKPAVETLSVTDDDDSDPAPKKKKKPSSDVECVTLDSDEAEIDDDEDVLRQPVAKRRRRLILDDDDDNIESSASTTTVPSSSTQSTDGDNPSSFTSETHQALVALAAAAAQNDNNDAAVKMKAMLAAARVFQPPGNSDPELICLDDDDD